jgi:glycosyltransferase involved in cell wall biosynthesis
MKRDSLRALSSSPRVLLVGPALSGGGAEGRFRRVAVHLFQGRSEVAVLRSPPISHGLTQVVHDLRWSGQASYPRIIYKLARLLRRGRYEAVMAFGMFPNLVSVMAAKFAAFRGPVIVHEISRPFKLAEQLATTRRLLYLGLQRAILPFADVVTANSIDGLNETVRLCRPFTGLTARLGNAMDAAGVLQRAASVAEKPDLPTPYIVCVARLDHMKRLDTVIDALALIADRVPHSLVIVGAGEAREALMNRARSIGLAQRVVFTGALENPMPIVASASALVVASEYEGFSNSLLESMFLGVPVLTSFCSADATEMCAQGAALGFEVGDAETLAKQLFKLNTEPRTAAELLAAAQIYREFHTLAKSIEEYERLILQAIAQQEESIA